MDDSEGPSEPLDPSFLQENWGLSERRAGALTPLPITFADPMRPPTAGCRDVSDYDLDSHTGEEFGIRNRE